MAFQNPYLRYIHKFLYILFHDKTNKAIHSVFIGIKPSDSHFWYHSLGSVEAWRPYQQPRLQEQNTVVHRSWNQVCGVCKVNIPLSWLYLRALILKYNWCSSWFFLELTVNCPKFVVLFWTIDDPNQPNYSQAWSRWWLWLNKFLNQQIWI